MPNKPNKDNIAIVGLGYVGLPLAVSFDKAGFFVIGFDINKKKIAQMKRGIDPANEIDSVALKKSKIKFTDNPANLRKTHFIIAAIPTPVTPNNEPDLTLVKNASRLIGENLTRGQIVVFESTVYPGVTEEVCAPIMEKYSSLQCGKDFKIGYSPERINPGDKEHTIETIIKVVSGMDQESLEEIADLYSTVCKAGVHKTSSIKVAEAAKIIENIQRDLNIALMNELTQIFHKLRIDTHEVLEAAGTKWNFHKYTPGLVGGHCIGVDPYYLTHLAQKLGHHPQVILAGRHINDSMAYYVADMLARELRKSTNDLSQTKVLVMGLTFKENVRDSRNSKAFDLIKRLREEYEIKTLAHDCFIDKKNIAKEYPHAADILIDNPMEIKNLDGLVICAAHNEFLNYKLEDFNKILNPNAVIIDIKGVFKNLFQNSSYIYKRL